MSSIQKVKKMSEANIGWLFYKGYYNKLTDDDYKFMLLSKDEQKQRNSEKEAIENKIKIKVQNIISQKPTIEEAEVLGSTHFTATTTYPGLLLGSGNAHELPNMKGQAILGFHFDYTSGLPVIQGSSIKGVLKSAFKHSEYIEELLNNKTIDIKALEDEIFENNDIFFDATISKADGKILGDDYITPHKEELKNPIPLRFIKVLPDISFRFDFELNNGLISKDEKVKLFKQIIEDLGLGAKTNIGYGKFEIYKTSEEKEREKAKEESERVEKERVEKAKKEAEEFAQKCTFVLESKNIQILDNFIKDYPDYEDIEKFKSERDSLQDGLNSSKFKKVDKDADSAWRELQNKKSNSKQYQKLLDKFIKKWDADKNSKKSLHIKELVEKAKKDKK